MKSLVFIFGAFFFTFCCDLTLAAVARYDSKIVGGEITDIKKVPYMVSVQRLEHDGSYQHICGASILSREWLLSAAHCFEELGRTFYVRVGSTLNNNGGQFVKVRTLLHTDFDSDTYANDIALLKMERSITISKATNTSVIALPKQGAPVRENSTARVSGWGETLVYDGKENFLRSVKVPIIGLEKCRNQYANMEESVEDNSICAGYLGVEEKDSCLGDSGGPLVNDRGVQIGIVSWGEECAHASYPGVYTMVSSFRNWIKENSGV